MPAGLLDLLYESITDIHKFIAVCGQQSLRTRSSKGARPETWEQEGCMGLKRHSAASPQRLCTSPWSWPPSQLPWLHPKITEGSEPQGPSGRLNAFLQLLFTTCYQQLNERNMSKSHSTFYVCIFKNTFVECLNICVWKDHQDYILLAFPRETLQRPGKCKVIKMTSAYKDEVQTICCLLSSWSFHLVFI